MPYDKNKIYPEYKIYKLCCDDTELFYIGSTRDFTTRKSRHKNCCNKTHSPAYNTKKYQTIREFGGWDAWRMVVIDILYNVTKLQAEMREEQLRVQIKAKLNSIRATRGDMSVKEYRKIYREENKDYYIDYCRQYYENNKQEIREKEKQKYNENKQKISEKGKIKIECECGAHITNGGKSQHFKSKKHQKYVDSLENDS